MWSLYINLWLDEGFLFKNPLDTSVFNLKNINEDLHDGAWVYV